MRVRMRTTYAGRRGTCKPGGIIDVPDDEAQQLIAGRYAEPVDGLKSASASQPELETATLATPETAATRTQRPAGRRRRSKE